MSDDLPEGWAVATLKDVVSFALGGDWGTNPDTFGDDLAKVRVVRGTDFKTWREDKGTNAAERCIRVSSLTKRRLQEGDLVLEVSGGGPNQPVGRTVLIDDEALTRADAPLVCSNFFRLLRLHAEIDPSFISHCLAYSYGRGAFNEFQTETTNLRNLNVTDFLDKTNVALAPLAEQHRIVEKLEQLLGKVDACQQRLAKVPRQLKRFRQSVLAAACSGRLTTDWREENAATETGEGLLNDVLKRRADFWKQSARKGACPEAPAAETSELPELPHGWAWIPLSLLGMNPFETVQTGPFGALLHKEEFTSSGVPVVAVGNLTGMGFTKEGLYFVSKSKARDLSRFDIQAGDVLFARSGATLGKVCVAPEDAKDWRMTGHILRARLNRDFILPDFCVFALRGDPAVTRQVFGSVQGTTRPGYNTTLLESIALPVAPLAEQQEIVRRVEGLFALADQIEDRLEKAEIQINKLTPSLFARAFGGELVPTEAELARQEGRSYEPASVLLGRVQQQRSREERRAARPSRSTASTVARKIKRTARPPRRDVMSR